MIKKMLTFEKCDKKNILQWLNIVVFEDSSVLYDFHAFVYLTEVELYEIELDGCMETNNGMHKTSSFKHLPSPRCLI